MGRYEELRQHTRCPVSVPGEVRLSNGVYVEGTTRDVSLGGVSLACSLCLPVGHRVRVTLNVQGAGTDANVVASGIVQRADRGGVAIQFDSIESEVVNTLEHLILFNVHDPNSAEHVLAGGYA